MVSQAVRCKIPYLIRRKTDERDAPNSTKKETDQNVIRRDECQRGIDSLPRKESGW